MRNLGFQSSSTAVFSNANPSAIAVDLETDAIFVTSDRQNADGDVEIEIWRVNSASNDFAEPVLVTLFTSNLLSTISPFSSQVVSVRILPDSRSLCVILRGGDIVTVPLDNDEPIADVVGSVDFGILRAVWSPDDSLLALVTDDDKLILMTSTFDVISEGPLHTTDFGEDAQINVGWGSKQTQFHGSLGKSAAQAPPTSLDNIGSSPDDDLIPRVSWRGDGAFFAVSCLSPENAGTSHRRRIIRVYNREATLQSTSEPVAGLEHVLSWRPSGNMIVSTQRFGFDGGGVGKDGRHDIVIFERNGLRHGEFGLRQTAVDKGESYKVKELNWSSDSNVLAVWIEHRERDVVQLWTTANYHWYLKHEIKPPESQRFTSVTWHPENGLQLFLTTATRLVRRTYNWETWVSMAKAPNDTGSVAVLDGANVLLTTFRLQNVPPPMSSHQLSLTCQYTPVHASFSDKEDILALLWESGLIQVWDLKTKISPRPGKAMEPIQLWEGPINDEQSLSFRRIAISSTGVGKSSLAALGSSSSGPDVLVMADINDSDLQGRKVVNLPGRNGDLVLDDLCSWKNLGGELFRVNYMESKVEQVATFIESCSIAQKISAPVQLFVGLAQTGKLHVSNLSGATYQLATNANSFTVASGYIVYTTTSHEAHFVSAEILAQSLNSESKILETEKRRVERGSRIVTAIPSNMSLVLQMPRGNLETINPRPLVMEGVRQDIDAGDYRKAFLACRKHRIDLNLLVEHNPDAFFIRLPSFLQQIENVDYINLFLTSIGRGSQPAALINKVCDNIRLELERIDLEKYINSILTAHVLKNPPDHEAGLSLLLRLREGAPNLVEDAVKYIIFLVDADSLFDLALGMYDFSLVLMIAQHAQKDPREYLPFLRELRAMDKYYQRFKIDDYLKRYEKALWNLSLAGTARFEEAMLYAEQHRLYEQALSMWKGTNDYNSVLNLYGDWLFERREFSQAALVFVEAGKVPKAMIAHEKALEWQELFDLAARDNMDEEDILSLSFRVADDLVSKKRYSEAARVFLDYTGDVRQAVIAFVEGNLFAEARRIVTLHNHLELVTEIIHPGALESKSQISEEIAEMKAQLRKQNERIRELRIRKMEEPDAFYGNEDVDLHDIDVMTDVSVAPTTFTRYTAAPSTMSKKSKQSSRSRRKAERKAGSGRKGTVDEEEYLLQSVAKLVARLASVQAEAGRLLPYMLQFTEEHRKEGHLLQEEITNFQEELRLSVDEIWTKEAESESSDPAKPPDSTKKILKPDIIEPQWRVKLWEVKESRFKLSWQ